MKNFEEAALRLKTALKVTQDKDLARALDISPRAWAGRKQRDSFPIKEVFALSQRRPELKLDSDWVVTGRSAYIITKTKLETRLVECYRICDAQERAQIDKFVMEISKLLERTGEEINQRMAAYDAEIEMYR